MDDTLDGVRRRQVLTAAGSAATAGLAGCANGLISGGRAPTRTPPAHTPRTPTADAAYPDYEPADGHLERLLGYDEIEPASAPLVLEPGVRHAELPRSTLSFTLRNRSDRRFQSDFYGWALHRFEAGAWHYVAPPGAKIIGSELPPGESHTWDLTVANADLASMDLTDGGTESLTVRGLGGGIYAFSIDGWWAGEGRAARVVAAARFRLAGGPVALRPSDRVTEATLSEGTVTVKAQNPEYQDAPPAVYRLERAPDATDPATVITEWAIRSWPQRDALAYLTRDVETVRVETQTGAVAGDPFGVSSDWPPMAYEGDAFWVAAERR